MASSDSWLHTWEAFDDISGTTLTCWNRSGSVRSSCRWQSCYVSPWKGKDVPKVSKSHQLNNVKLQVLMELQFLPSCNYPCQTTRSQCGSFQVVGMLDEVYHTSEIAQMALKKDHVKFIQSQSPAVIQWMVKHHKTILY